MKRTLLIFIYIAFAEVFTVSAQIHTTLPHKTFKDYEVSKPILYTQTVTYDAHDKGYDPVMVTVNSFNEQGQFIQEYLHILGKFESETAHNYIYNNGRLDSLNTLATAKNFNVKTSFEYNSNGKVAKETASGVYSKYTRHFKYNKKGDIESITTDFDNGGHNWTTFTYKNGKLDLVTQIDGQVKEGSLTNYFAYYNGELFARWDNLDKDLYVFPSAFMHYKLPKHPEPLATVNNLRELQATNKTAYNKELNSVLTHAEVTFEMGQSTPENGDWTRRMTKETRFGGTTRRFHFRKIVYADGKVSGSTEFDYLFFNKMKDL
ncbi:hypothetical protein [Siansivirga zeaxanthinifaciens]|uniref:Sugar-binding protein n=1 Tax=Siansivirga zeaxanthinifaciens CC-SAMT-1 TaxID=1454006 RepID=A0A0C5WPE1_9FLAO|nr:hypothetical protein [Siansivirga zeaxanthinifaciens]AJR04755.1 hypothetical protein AW14_03140 [Siansivirga zeaxanthinifaciens CC-SAMT-1]